jgi:membrane fusion protein (multidrug efflux system)
MVSPRTDPGPVWALRCGVRGTPFRFPPGGLLRSKPSLRLAACTLAVSEIALLVSSGCVPAAATSGAAEAPPTVLVAAVVREDVPTYAEWVGTLDGSSNAQIRAQVSGYVQTIKYREGSFVKKGERLFEIDPRPYKAVLDQAKGQLARAEADLGKTELDVKRLTPLAKQQAISQQDLDDAVQANLGARSQVAAVKATVEQAAINFGYTSIDAPIDGIAGMALSQIGDLVGAGVVLTTVSTVDPIRGFFETSEQEYDGLLDWVARLEAMPLEERPEDGELILATGRVHSRKGRFEFVGRQVDVHTGSIRMIELFANPGNVLRPGQFVRVRIPTSMTKGALLVPQRAVAELQGSYHVDVVSADNKVEVRPVKPGRRVGSNWIIDAGLHAGEHVIVEGLQKARAGTLVVPEPFMAGEVAPPSSRSVVQARR